MRVAWSRTIRWPARFEGGRSPLAPADRHRQAAIRQRRGGEKRGCEAIERGRAGFPARGARLHWHRMRSLHRPVDMVAIGGSDLPKTCHPCEAGRDSRPAPSSSHREPAGAPAIEANPMARPNSDRRVPRRTGPALSRAGLLRSGARPRFLKGGRPGRGETAISPTARRSHRSSLSGAVEEASTKEPRGSQTRSRHSEGAPVPR